MVVAVALIRLTTTGCISGLPREVSLYGFEDGERLVIVGSAGGAAKDPAWVVNLRAQPLATLRRGRHETQVRAREVIEPSERERLWRLVCEAFPMYETFQRRSARRIPLFLLEG
jgi:deazaflavin-dependent oxidoreductase (nitroreductase family)